ncbi:MAG: Spy/CpxP family protein refolding chaperone [Pseudanabaenaceae cyanobacterium bins.39]|nr:Spy/CpxP family protein refolding chaperone [Pseudanabaenaceae cyanobacterium bins.39]
MKLAEMMMLNFWLKLGNSCWQLLKSKEFRYGAIATLIIGGGAMFASSATDANQDNLGNSIAQIADSQPNPDLAELPNPSGGLMPSGRILKQLNLTNEQLQKIKEIGDRDREAMRDLARELKQDHQELRQLLVSNESNDAIRTKHQELQSKQTKLRQLTFERMLAMREVLTPEQRSQLNEIVQKNRRLRDNGRDRLEKRLENRFENRPLRQS